MSNIDKTAILKRLSRTLANRSLPESRLQDIASAISEARNPVVGIDVCTVGICLDIAHDGPLAGINLADFADERLGDIKSIEIFPEGIVLPDATRVRITHAF